MTGKIAFVVAGAQKCGTSLLRKYLAQHPGIGISRKKEVHFFDGDERFRSNAVDYEPYHAQYRHCSPAACWGDVTPAYLFWLPAAGRIHAYNPNMKSVIVLRNPVERAFSHWNMMRLKGLEERSFTEALQAETRPSSIGASPQDKAFSYIARGHYAEQLQRWFSFFPRRQCHVLRLEDLAFQYQAAMEAVYAFLGLPKVMVTPRFANVRPYDSALHADDRRYLQALYMPGIQKLGVLLEQDFSDWLG